jgi:SAP domain
MSRQIPMDKPLSAEDREYLHARGEHQRVEQMDETFGVEEEEEDLDQVPLEDWTVDELKAELLRLGLPTTGKKPELVERVRGARPEAL